MSFVGGRGVQDTSCLFSRITRATKKLLPLFLVKVKKIVETEPKVVLKISSKGTPHAHSKGVFDVVRIVVVVCEIAD